MNLKSHITVGGVEGKGEFSPNHLIITRFWSKKTDTNFATGLFA